MPKNNDNKIKLLKNKKPSYTFNMKRIIKEREAERKKNPAFDDLIKNCVLSPEDLKETTNVDEDNEVSSALPVSPKEYDFVDGSKYNIPFTDDPDSTKRCLQRLRIMAIELNEIVATIHFNFLLNADWSPVLKDFEDVLQDWHIDLVLLTTNKPLLKHEIKDCNKIGWHNFELVLRFIHYSVMKHPGGFNDNDLLTLAKYTVKMYFNPYCRRVITIIKKLFSICIETALLKAENTAIELFAQELYSCHPVEDLLEMVVDLFLPIKGGVMETIYSYLAYSLFNTLLGKNNENTVTFPTSINNWFVQDLVDINYFKQNSIDITYNVISLLEHIVAVFDLYENEKKLSVMYDFLHAVIKKDCLSESQIYINKMDQWRLRLDTLRMQRPFAKDSPIEQLHKAMNKPYSYN